MHVASPFEEKPKERGETYKLAKQTQGSSRKAPSVQERRSFTEVTAKGDIVSTKAVKKGLRKLEAYVQEMAKGDAVPTVNIQMVQDDAVKLWTLVNGSHHCQGTGVPVLMSAQTTLEMAAAIRGIVAFTSAPTDHAGRSPSRDINYRAANARSNERNLLKEEVELRAKLGQPLKLTSASAPLPLNRRLHARRKSY
ncbi:3-oxoacyl-[acyl-carrier-protein] synthase [Tulasnella sp. 425]|nr:3-oxoacyl-[acyl-carrier-protein] synthase [Tulasnella sp. 425]